MDNPIDHPFDLGLVNYIRHPDNQNYVVFRFPDIERAKSFETELQLAKIWYEKADEESKSRVYTLFGIHKNDYKRAEKINFLVEAKHKKPLIPWAIFRYFILIISIIAMTLALIGYCDAQKKLQRINDRDITINQNS